MSWPNSDQATTQPKSSATNIKIEKGSWKKFLIFVTIVNSEIAATTEIPTNKVEIHSIIGSSEDPLS
jgi:hypothetical protein